MKRFLYILVCLLLSISVKAQLIYNEEGEVVPFSMSEKYKNLIDTSKVNACTLKSYNNDSLYISYNKNLVSAFNDEIVAGFPIDTLINIRTRATKYQIGEGTLWLYKVESRTAEMINIEMKNLIIPVGAYICIFPKKEELAKKRSRLFLKKDIPNPNFRQHQYGNQLFIEYFEPNNTETKANVVISSVDYIFISPFRKKH